MIASKILGVLLNKTDMDQLARYSDFGGPEKFRNAYDKYYQSRMPDVGPPRRPPTSTAPAAATEARPVRS